MYIYVRMYVLKNVSNKYGMPLHFKGHMPLWAQAKLLGGQSGNGCVRVNLCYQT